MDFNDRQSRITSGTDSGSNLLTSMTTYSDDYVLAYNYTNATCSASSFHLGPTTPAVR